MTTATKLKADQWSWWRAALAGTIGDVLEDEPQSGFYRAKNGEPVAFWRDREGSLYCHVGDGVAPEGPQVPEWWMRVAKRPVTKADYDARRKTGRWPDMPEDRVLTNLPSDPYAALKAEVDDKIAQAVDFLEREVSPITKTKSDMARNIQAQLLDLVKRATVMHVAEKAPHLAAGRAVDDRFRFRETVENVAKRLRGVFETFMRAEERRLREEAQAKFEAERAAAENERHRLIAERAIKLDADPIAALTDPPVELPVVPIAPEPVKVMAGGGVGRRAGLRTEYRGVIDDYAAALGHFAAHPDVKALVTKLVNAAVRAGKSETRIPGVTVHEERVAS